MYRACNSFLTAFLPPWQTYLEAAKTKFTKNYKGMNPSKITTTVGLNIGKIDIAGVRFNFWDLGGQEELRSLWDKVMNILRCILEYHTCSIMFINIACINATHFPIYIMLHF